MKNQKGITLVALVITIIVLLILAGVSISLVVGDNGILTKATSAAEKTDLASVESGVQLAISTCVTNFTADTYVNNYNAKLYNTLTVDQLEAALNSNGLQLCTKASAETNKGVYLSDADSATTNLVFNSTPSQSVTIYVSTKGAKAGENIYKFTIVASGNTSMTYTSEGMLTQ